MHELGTVNEQLFKTVGQMDGRDKLIVPLQFAYAKTHID